MAKDFQGLCGPTPTLRKIPGLMPVIKSDSTIKDLTKLTQWELLDLKAREQKLLANKKKLCLLPDKGKRLQDFYDKVLHEIERRTNIDDMMSELSIIGHREETLNKLEWEGRLNGISNDNLQIHSDDEAEVDTLNIIANKSLNNQRIVKVLPPEQSLITTEDLADIAALKTVLAQENTNTSTAKETVDAELVSIDVGEKLSSIKSKLKEIREKPNIMPAKPEIDGHIKYVIKKTEMQPKTVHEKFNPHRTTITNVHDPAKESTRKVSANWEITAATPPPLKHEGTKMLTLLDSVTIQTEYLKRLKDVQEKEAAERLAAKIERMQSSKIVLPDAQILKSSSAFTAYRSIVNPLEGNELLNIENEVTDHID